MGYIANIFEKNYENNFYTIITNIRIKIDYIYYSCIYSNIDDGKKNLTFILLLAIDNSKATNLSLDLLLSLIIFYYNKN